MKTYKGTFSTDQQPDDGWGKLAADQWERINAAAVRFGVKISDPPDYDRGREWYGVNGERARGFFNYINRLSSWPMGLTVEAWPVPID